MPGQSGNLAGRPKGDGVVRRLILEALRKNRKAAFKAIEARLRSPKYVQDVLELLAKLEGELSKDAQEGARQGVDVIVIRGEGAIDPAEFRRNAMARMAREAMAGRGDVAPQRR